MLKTLRLITIAVAAALALPAVAGPSWPPTPPRKDVGKECHRIRLRLIAPSGFSRGGRRLHVEKCRESQGFELLR